MKKEGTHLSEEVEKNPRNVVMKCCDVFPSDSR